MQKSPEERKKTRTRAEDSSSTQRKIKVFNKFTAQLTSMNTYYLDPKNFDLELTMTCGQTFCWNRLDGKLYGEGKPGFYTFRKGKPVFVEDKKDSIEVETALPKKQVEKALGLDKDLERIFNTFPEDEPLEKARKHLWGLRIVQDEFFPCLISYLCSPQMQIPRIKKMHNKIAEKYGEKTEFNNKEIYRFPNPEELVEASEDDLRRLGVGYRAKYIVESTKMVVEGFSSEEVKGLDYFEAREEMKQLYGVGDKVADCVMLFSLGFYEAYPMDTWAMKALEKYYPRIYSEDYEETSKKLRDRFGEYSGYAQEYLFHAARQGIIEV